MLNVKNGITNTSQCIVIQKIANDKMKINLRKENRRQDTVRGIYNSENFESMV